MLYLLLGPLSFIFFGFAILPIILLIVVLNLRGRIKKLEQAVHMGKTFNTIEPQLRPLSQPLSIPIHEPQPVIPQTPIASAETKPDTVPLWQGPTAFDRFVEWIKEDWLMKLGALLLLIGFGWLTTYAFLNNWIGPMGRIVLGILAGVLFIVLGWWRIKNYVHQGSIFLVLGSTTVLLTIFAARMIYDFFTPFSALAVMFLSTAFVALASVKYSNKSLALASLILAGIAPFLTNAPSPDYIGLFAYLFVVIFGVLWIVVLTGNRGLTTAALILVVLYSLPHLFPFTYIASDQGALLLFAYAFAALFFLTNTVGLLKLRGKDIMPDLGTAAANGLFLLVWIMSAAPDEWKSLIISAWMIVFGVGAFLIFRLTERREPFYIYMGVCIAMLATATAVELEGAALTIAYIVESGMITLISYLMLRDIKVAEHVSFLFAVPMILSATSISSSAWATSILHKDFFVLFLLGSVLFGLGIFFLRHAREGNAQDTKKFSMVLFTAGSLYAYVLLWLSLHTAFFDDNTAVMIALAIYTVVGLACYFYGLHSENRGLKLYGGVLVGFVVARLLLVDVWSMELSGRIATFFIIGALLTSTAFLGRRKKDTQILSSN